jgi:hypothetical protein
MSFRELVEHFPSPATRVDNIDDVRRFLWPYVVL